MRHQKHHISDPCDGACESLIQTTIKWMVVMLPKCVSMHATMHEAMDQRRSIQGCWPSMGGGWLTLLYDLWALPFGVGSLRVS